MLGDFASAGNRFGAPRAGDWNALRRAAQAHERHGLSVPGRPLGNALRPGTVRVKNELPFDLPRRRILGIDGMLATTDDDVVLRGTVPTPGQHAGGRWVVTAEPIAAGAIGRAWAYGVAKVPVNVVDFAHGFADVVQVGTVTYVTSTPASGARILHPATEPGEQLMAVLLGGAPAPEVAPPGTHYVYNYAATRKAEFPAGSFLPVYGMWLDATMGVVLSVGNPTGGGGFPFVMLADALGPPGSLSIGYATGMAPGLVLVSDVNHQYACMEPDLDADPIHTERLISSATGNIRISSAAFGMPLPGTGLRTLRLWFDQWSF